MLKTNCEYLSNEIMDVVRLFGVEDDDFTHYFSFSDGEFYNCIQYDGKFYDFIEKQDVSDDEEFKRFSKRFAKLAMYKVLSDKKGVSYPWGALTGIRPTKMAYQERALGRDFSALFSRLGVSDDNIRMIVDVLDCQKDVYAENFHCGADIFVSIPFCPTKCDYCSFITAPIKKTSEYVDAYVDTLIKEIDAIPSYCRNINSVYVGGGTPFTLSEEQLGRVLSSCKKLIDECASSSGNFSRGGGDFRGRCEFTVEAGRPDTFTDEKLGLCEDFGVNRICVNPQSFTDKTLVAIGRAHTADDVFRAYDMARVHRFSVNLDLIAGLYDESVDEFVDSVAKTLSLRPENVTVHTLCLKSGANLKENVKRLSVLDIDDMISASRRMLSDSGYRPYYLYRQKYQAGGNENVGWCLPGRECVYNIDTMEEICDNIAVGANAISKRVFKNGAIERLATPKDIKTYLEKSDSLNDRRVKFFSDSEDEEGRF